MKIIFVIKALDNVGGGAERVLADVSRGLSENGHEITIVTYDPPGGESYYALHPAVKRIALGIGRTDRSATLRETLWRMVALRRVIVQQAPDIAVGFMHSVFVPLGLALLGVSIPVIASEHIVSEHYRNRHLERLLLKVTPYLTKCITVVSEQVKDSYAKALRQHMVSIPNPVSVRPQVRADVTGSDRKRKTLLTVGRLTAQKDHKTLLQAFSMIASLFPNWDLRIVGDGELKQELEIIIKMLGFEERVQLPGNNPEIGKEYVNAQLFVIPSLYESFGLATAEALAYGLPCVGFLDCPGVNYFIRSGKNGILVSGNNRATSLSNALKILMSDEDKRKQMGENATLIKKPFDKKEIIEQWESLLMKYCKC